MTIAFTVNSAGDSVAGTYGWKPVVVGDCAAGVAMTPDLNIEFCYNPGRVCENVEQRGGENRGGQTDHRAGLRAHHEPAFRLPALPLDTRRGRCPHHLLAGAGRAVSPERSADPQGPRVL